MAKILYPNYAIERYHRKIIHIPASESPNVKLGLTQAEKGIEPTDEVIVPGVITYSDYIRKRKILDKVKQSIALDARWWEGAEQLLFPPDWLDLAAERARALRNLKDRRAKGIGCDPGEGVSKTSWSLVDEFGHFRTISLPTIDTSIIVGQSIALLKEHRLDPQQFCFDRGGGGLQHADRMRAMGYNVRTVGFGESVNLEPKRGMRYFREKVEVKEERYSYLNRRAQMYHELSLLIDPTINPSSWGILDGSGTAPPDPVYVELRRQLCVMPKLTDEEGRYWMLPKQRRDPNDRRPTLTDIIGHSPDEADSLVLAVYAMLHIGSKQMATVGV